MLNSSHPHKSTKIHQYILRRRARNLRAKVKALLPPQICCKHDQRNRCVRDIQNNKKIWQYLHSKNQWAMGQQKQNIYYYENHQCMDHYERFEKLTDSQIQQIKEDRLYYLGEENLEDFEQFLQERCKVKENGQQNQHQRQANTNSEISKQHFNKTFSNILLRRMPDHFKSSGLGRNSEQSQYLSNENCSSYVALQRTQKSCLNSNKVQRRKHKISVDQKLRQFEQRRKLLEVQQKSKALVQKVKLNMKLERAQTILKQIKTKKLSQFETRRLERQQHLERITNRKRNQQNQGEIKQLQEQLRRTFLNKMKGRVSKTANVMTRTLKIGIF